MLKKIITYLCLCRNSTKVTCNCKALAITIKTTHEKLEYSATSATKHLFYAHSFPHSKNKLKIQSYLLYRNLYLKPSLSKNRATQRNFHKYKECKTESESEMVRKLPMTSTIRPSLSPLFCSLSSHPVFPSLSVASWQRSIKPPEQLAMKLGVL